MQEESQTNPQMVYEDYGQSGHNYIRVNNKNDTFLQWFLENKQGIENLRFMWRGWERDIYGRWIKTDRTDNNRLMNEKGIHWASSVMENYLDRVFQSTNWNDDHMNYEMRKVYRVIWFGLMKQYSDFEISKVNCYGIASQILARVHAMLLASRGEGIRKFIGTTQTISEQRLINPQEQNRGIFSGVKSIFSKG